MLHAALVGSKMRNELQVRTAVGGMHLSVKPQQTLRYLRATVARKTTPLVAAAAASDGFLPACLLPACCLPACLCLQSAAT